MADLRGFDATKYEPNEGFDVLPAGEYDAVIIASTRKPNKKNNGELLELDLQILSGQFQNRKLWDRLNIKHPNPQAQQIGLGTLSAICRAVDVLTPKDSSELHNKPLRVKVKIKKEDGFNDKNEIVAYKPRQAGPAPGTPAAGQSLAQQTFGQQPANGHPAGQAAPAPTGNPW